MTAGRSVWQVARRLGSSLLASAALLVGACAEAGTGPVEPPQLPGNPTANPQFRSASFIFDVNQRTGAIKVTAPTLTVNGVSASLSPEVNGLGGPDLSLIGGDVIDVTASGFAASAVGGPCAGGVAGQPGKVCVTFDVNLTNKLNGVQLIGPTVFPAPPAGTTGVILFPFDLAVTVTSGGVSTGGQGNDVLIELPSNGVVTVNDVWNGAPHNFFNDVGCAGNDCFRWEEFAGPVAPGATTTAEKVGFFVDPTVGNFRARLIVAADLQNASGGVPTGTVDGTVSSPQIGALSGVTVTVTSGGFVGTTSASGQYTIGSVTTGPKTVSLSNLPAGCVDPGLQNTTVTTGGTATVNFTVQCTAPSGTVAGTVTSSLGGGIAGVSVTVAPGGSTATNGSGAYSVGAPVGSGTVTVSNLPGNCVAPAGQPYTIASGGATATVNFTVQCTAPSPNSLNGTWTVSGSTATLELRVNITSGNVGSLQAVFNKNSTRLTYTGSSAATAPTFPNPTAGNPPQTNVTFGGFSTSSTGETGNLGVIRLTFSIGAGSPETAQGTITNFQIFDNNFNDVLPTFSVNIAPLVLP